MRNEKRWLREDFLLLLSPSLSATHTHTHTHTHTRVYTLCAPENPCEFYSESSWNKSKRTLFIIAGWANVPNATFIIHAAAFSEKRLRSKDVRRSSAIIDCRETPKLTMADFYISAGRENGYPSVAWSFYISRYRTHVGFFFVWIVGLL